MVERIVTEVGVLDKVVLVLDVIGRSQPIKLNQLIRESGLPKATAHRLVGALEAHGFVRRDRGGLLTQGPRFGSVGLPHLAAPTLRALAEETGESAQLYVRRGPYRLCVAAVESVAELRTTIPVGALLSIERGSAGKVLRGDPEVLRKGWAESAGERAPGVASVSAPVYAGPRILAAVSISGPIDRLGESPGRKHAKAVRAAARRIEHDVEGQGPLE